MKQKLILVSRILLGVIFFVFGLNGVLLFTRGSGFIPVPPLSGDMATIMTGFMATKYLMPLVKVLEVLAGFLLLAGIYINASLVLLAPIVVNILGMHFIVDRSGAPMAILVLVLYAILLKWRWPDFKALLKK